MIIILKLKTSASRGPVIRVKCKVVTNFINIHVANFMLDNGNYDLGGHYCLITLE